MSRVVMSRVLISMPETFLKSIDELAEVENRTRSELIREALRRYVKKPQYKDPKKAEIEALLIESLLSWQNFHNARYS